MAPKRGLGKGLDMLIPTGDAKKSSSPRSTGSNAAKKAESSSTTNTSTPSVPVAEPEVKEIEKTLRVSELEPNSNQPRKVFEEDALQELADSIKEFGIIQPIVVTPKNKKYEIIAGERRWRAARLAGLKEVPVIIRDYTEQQIVEISLIENIQRENLNPIEEALAYQRLVDEFSLKQDDVAERVSKSRATITNSLRLLKLCKNVQQMVIDDKISSGHARALLAIDDADLQYEVACKVFDESLSVRQTEALVKKLNTAPKDQPKEEIKHPYLYTDTEELLKQILGSKVSIKAKSNDKGKIEIEYYSSDELDALVDKLRELQN